jgi:signal transduction histidine kinase/ActR/RegA family two-component response regulator
MNIVARLQSLTDWLTPDHLKGDLHTRKRVQMFVISHLFGPFIAAPIPIFLSFADPNPLPHVPILAASIFGFWLFLPLLKMFPRAYVPMALVSVLNLTFAVLWGSFNYGGTSSPFLMWFVLTPLLAFMYFGSNWSTRLFVGAQIVLGIGAFYGFYLLASFPVHIPVEDMVVAGVLSALGTTTYVFVMAVYYANVVDNQSELVQEITRHQDTLKMLTDAKDEAERANGAKSDFLAKMSHELRTPLNAVLGYSEILLEDAELDGRGEQIADLQKISAAGKHLLAMVNDILDISKIEAGKMTLNIEPVDLDALVAEVDATARPLAAKNANSFIIDSPETLGLIEADATKLRQAVFNLISNAAKFTHNGRITMSTRKLRIANQNWVEIAISDTGIGISKEQQQALFSNFTQANSKIAATYGGTGLGLALSQNICKLMGGNISIESELGHGSRFAIRLPMPEEAVIEAPVPAQQSTLQLTPAMRTVVAHPVVHARGEAPRKRFLIVDDDRPFLELAERLFRKEGYDPIVTDAPQSALQLARTMQPAAIFLDIMMPGFDGWDVLAALKMDPATSHIPVLMISILDERARAIQAGADGVVPKPLDSSKVRAAVAALQSAKVARPERRVVNG